ncbi:EF-hand domain-containing family member B-like isoform X2 [Anoplophora glabripennis]|uniref:EF-hand domain-containing family member B-like isoform X2 n=1 Tax=Anoplophora glabripennis TaxID=217634 RepID=UPI0008743D03|nr:EF-hand domain-containing family member B-like isoform X2 [Anoplophora glabripennis]
MANKGKFIDRIPIIHAAGKSTEVAEDTVTSTLRECSLRDQTTSMKHDTNISKEDVSVPPSNVSPNKIVKEILNLPPQTECQELIEDLKDAPHETEKQVELTTQELVSPPEPPYKVIWDSHAMHERYKKTHDDFNPSERISRGYDDHFDPAQKFEGKTQYDARGIWVRCACEWHSHEPIICVDRIQANFNERTKPQVGKVLSPNHNLDCVPKGHSFGRVKPESSDGISDLITNSNQSSCLFKRDFYKWLGSLNDLKLSLKHRSDEDFHFNDFCEKALHFDKNHTGWLPVDTFFELCMCHKLTFPKEDIESLMRIMNIIVDDKVEYGRFIEIINVNSPMFQIMEFHDIPKTSRYYVGPDQAATCDYMIMDSSGMHAAGLPSVHSDHFHISTKLAADEQEFEKI